MDKLTLKAELRKVQGRKVKVLRREGVLPANIYGKDVKSQAVQVSLNDFEKVFKKTGETGLIELVVEGKKRSVLIHNTQVDPVTDRYIHADFLQVNLKQKVTAQVPIELSGEAPAEKDGLGTVVQYIDGIEVEALPTELPDKFSVGLTKLTEVDGAIYVKNLEVDKKKVVIKNEPDQIIVKVVPLRKEEEVAPPKVEEEEGEEVSEEEVAEEGEKREAREGLPEEKEKETPAEKKGKKD